MTSNAIRCEEPAINILPYGKTKVFIRIPYTKREARTTILLRNKNFYDVPDGPFPVACFMKMEPTRQTATMEIQPLQTNNHTRLSRIGMKVAIPPYPGIRHDPPAWTEPAIGILEMNAGYKISG
ncbi:hypothetical protein ACMAUO_08260 [Gluconacetobacter sp. Hr-1-5]|uniref:hypothetical protein n=1 Tax=Gluconacetobacter sp. Hr-1-5 TaxID=3395370 RepID=UPI003B52D860